jgi:hypothetical protein
MSLLHKHRFKLTQLPGQGVHVLCGKSAALPEDSKSVTGQGSVGRDVNLPVMSPMPRGTADQLSPSQDQRFIAESSGCATESDPLNRKRSPVGPVKALGDRFNDVLAAHLKASWASSSSLETSKFRSDLGLVLACKIHHLPVKVFRLCIASAEFRRSWSRTPKAPPYLQICSWRLSGTSPVLWKRCFNCYFPSLANTDPCFWLICSSACNSCGFSLLPPFIWFKRIGNSGISNHEPCKDQSIKHVTQPWQNP